MVKVEVAEQRHHGALRCRRDETLLVLRIPKRPRGRDVGQKLDVRARVPDQREGAVRRFRAEIPPTARLPDDAAQEYPALRSTNPLLGGVDDGDAKVMRFDDAGRGAGRCREPAWTPYAGAAQGCAAGRHAPHAHTRE